MLAHLKKHVAAYMNNDQDLLNDFFRDRILILPPRCNFQGTHFFFRDDAYFAALRWDEGFYYSPAEIAAARKNPGIIHFFRFCGQFPWQPGNIHGSESSLLPSV